MAKRIAIVIDSMAGGGAEKVVITLAHGLMKAGHDVTLFVLGQRQDYKLPESLRVKVLLEGSKSNPKGWFNRQRLASKLQALVNQEQEQQGRFDLFLVNLEESYRIVSACHFSPCFYIIHNSLAETLKRTKKLGPLKYLYLKNILKHLSGKDLITVSKGIEQEIQDSELIDPASITTIYNPFDIEELRKLSAVVESRIPQQKYIIHVGRAAKQKRHDILFSALQHVPEDYQLVCLCNNSKKLTALINKLGLQDRVIVSGFVQNPYNWIKNAELLVLSSDYEGLPTVLIEALVCGTPVVSTNCPHGPSEILLGELSRYLVKVGDPVALAAKINEALNSSIDLGDIEILSKIQLSNITQQYLSLIKQ